MRMSSPTYDEQFGDMSQDDISAFDDIEARLSQRLPLTRIVPFPNSNIGSNEFCEDKAGGFSSSFDQELLSSQDVAAQDGDDNPFTSANHPPVSDASRATIGESFIKASAVIPPLGFKSAFSLPIENVDEIYRSPSPEAPKEVDYSSWFTSESAPSASFVGFQPASSRLAKENIFDASTVETPSVGFTSVGKGGLIVPSSAALRKAEEKMKMWQNEVNDVDASQHPGGFAPASFVQPPSSRRTVLGVVQNSFPSQVPDTPTPATTTRKPFEAGSIIRTPMLGVGVSDIKGKQKPFKSPLVSSTQSRQALAGAGSAAYLNSPLNPHRQAFAPACIPAVPATPIRPSVSVKPKSGFQPLGLTPRNLHGGLVKPKFITPFKPGIKPLEPSASATRPPAASSFNLQQPVYPSLATQSPRADNKAPDKGTGNVFNLGRPFRRNCPTMAYQFFLQSLPQEG